MINLPFLSVLLLFQQSSQSKGGFAAFFRRVVFRWYNAPGRCPERFSARYAASYIFAMTKNGAMMMLPLPMDQDWVTCPWR